MSDEQHKKPSLGDRFARRTGGAGLASTGPLPIVDAPMAQPSVSQQLTGNLKDKSIAYLLQVIDHFEATGQLQIGGFQYTVTIQFGLGKPIHAFSPFNSGTEAILELFTWQDGKISFTEGIQPERPTVEESAPQILTLGDEYVRNMEFLQKLDITELSYLLRSPLKLNDQELEKLLLSGAPINFKTQKEFYGNIYGTLNVKDIAIKMNLSQSRWMATVANLLRLGLILTPDGRTLEATGLSAPPAVQSKPAPSVPELKNIISAELSSTHNDSSHLAPAPSGSWSAPAKNGSSTGPLMPPAAMFQTAAPPSQDITQPFGIQPVPLTLEHGGARNESGANAEDEHRTPGFPQGLHQPGTSGLHQPGTSGLHQPGIQQSGMLQPGMPIPPTLQLPTPSPSHNALPSILQPSTQEPPAVAALQPKQTPLKSFHLGIPDEIVLFSGLGPASVMAQLTREETGILTQDAFEFFLEREFSRAFRFGAAFTFMPFCITVSATGWPVLPIESVALITRALNKMRREVDILGHFGERSFAFILPGVESAQGCGLVDRIATNLPQAIPELAHYAPILHFGIASVPQDAQDLTQLVAGGQRAMMEAAKRNVTRVRHIEITSPQTPETPQVPGQPVPPGLTQPATPQQLQLQQHMQQQMMLEQQQMQQHAQQLAMQEEQMRQQQHQQHQQQQPPPSPMNLPPNMPPPPPPMPGPQFPLG